MVSGVCGGAENRQGAFNCSFFNVPNHQPSFILIPVFQTGFYATVYFSDAKCTAITNAQYQPLGSCIYLSATSSLSYTSDPSSNNQIYTTSYSTSTCTGTAVGTSMVVGDATCVLSSSSTNGAYVQNVAFAATFPTTLASSDGLPVYPYTKQTVYNGGCSTLSTAVPSVINFSPLTVNTDTSANCGANVNCPAPITSGGTTTPVVSRLTEPVRCTLASCVFHLTVACCTDGDNFDLSSPGRHEGHLRLRTSDAVQSCPL